MTGYILRRLLVMIPTLILISLLVFLIIELPPGNFLSMLQAQLLLEDDELSKGQLILLTKRYGLDKPLMYRYALWFGKFLLGDMGESFAYEKPVSELVGQRIALSATVSLATLIFALIVAIPIGVYSAVRQYTLGDQFFTMISFIGLAIPNFLLALILIMVGMFVFGQTPGGLFSPEYIAAPWSWAKVLDLLGHLWVPIFVIGTAGMAGTMRVMRGEVLDVLGRQFVEAARAKGLAERRVVLKYVVRTALNPLVTGLGLALPGIIGGEVIVAIVLNLPTTGPLLYQALLVGDQFLAGSFLLVLSIFLLIGNLLADIALAWLDPRIRYD